jgi:hypothetical protein
MARAILWSSATFGLLVLAACKPPDQPKAGPDPVGPQVSVKADDLLKDYQSNALAADGKYKGKRIVITGKVGSVQKAPLYGYVLQLMPFEANELSLTGVTCILGHEPQPEVAQLKEGDSVKVIGTCDGQVVGQLKIAKCLLMK